MYFLFFKGKTGFETIERIVGKDVTTDENKEISKYVHRIVKYLCLLKKE